MAIGFQLRRYFIDWLHHARGTPGLSLDSGLDVKLLCTLTVTYNVQYAHVTLLKIANSMLVTS